MDEKEKEKEKRHPSWNRRGVAQRRGGRFKNNHFDLNTTPALRATPPVPGGELLLLLLQFIHNFIDRSYRS